MIHTAVQYGAHVTPEDVVRLVNENGGATISNDWRIAGGGWLVGLQGFEVKVPEITAHAVHAYMSQHNPAFMGLWRNPETGTIFLDTIAIVDDKMAAIELGVANEQLAIYNDLLGEEEDLRNWYPNVGLASVRTAAGEIESMGELGSYTLQVQRSRGWSASKDLLVAPNEENWVALSSVRLGASVEENAKATIDDLIGSRWMTDDSPDYKPARGDIEKMRNAWRLWEQGTMSEDEPERSSISPGAIAAQEWSDKYGLNSEEQGALNIYKYALANQSSSAYNDPQKAFNFVARVLSQPRGLQTMNGDTLVNELKRVGESFTPESQLPSEPTTEAKKILGNAIRKYEQQNYPMLYQAISNNLDDMYRTATDSYKMWPRMVTWIKDEFQDWLWNVNSGYNRRNQSPSAMTQLPHIRDIVQEGGRVLSQLRANHLIPANFDVNQLDFDEFEKWLMDWKRENRASEAQGEVVYEFHDGWTIQKLTTPEQLQFEGDEMGHCVGGYGYADRTLQGSTLIYSLRDPKGNPHVTMEMYAEAAYKNSPPVPNEDHTEYVHPDKHEPGQHKFEGGGEAEDHPFEVKQIMGKGNNTPKAEYQRKIKEFLDSLRAKGWSFEKSMNFHRPWDQGASEGDEYSLTDADDGYGSRDRNLARSLDKWYDESYKPNHNAYRGNHHDAYGLAHDRMRLHVKDWEEVFRDALGSLVEEYDPGRWSGDWADLARAVYHAWNVSIDSERPSKQILDASVKEIDNEISNAENTLDEWEMNTWDYAFEHVKDQIAEKIEELAQKRGIWEQIEQALEDEHEGMYGGDEIIEYVREHDEDLFYEAEDGLRDENQEEYSGKARKFLNYLYQLVHKQGMVGPTSLPDPQQTGGGLPSYDKLQEMPWPKEEESEEIPGTFSHVDEAWHFASFRPEEIQIHPIDQERNIYFDEDGNERPRWRPQWVKNPESGKMEQSGELEDSFLDRQGRQGQGYVAYHGDRPVGSLTYVDDPAGWYMLGTAYTHPEYREQGIFNRLVAPLRESGKPIDAYVWNNPWLKQKVRGWPMQKQAEYDIGSDEDPNVNVVRPGNEPPASTEDVWAAQRAADEAERMARPAPAIHWINNDSGYEYSRMEQSDYGLPFLYHGETNQVWIGTHPTFHSDIESADESIPYSTSHGRFNHLRHAPSEGYTSMWSNLSPSAQQAIEHEILKKHPVKQIEDEPESDEGGWDEMF